MRGKSSGLHKNWQVLSVALTVPYLEKFSQVKNTYREFSPLKRLIISKDWIRTVRMQVPVLGVGAIIQANTASCGLPVSEMADNKYHSLKLCKIVQFG